MPAKEQQTGTAGKLHRLLLGKNLPLGGWEDHIGPLPRRLADGLPAAVDGGGLHQHPPAAAVGAVVHPVVLVAGVVPDIPVPHLYLSGPLCPADDAFVGDRLAHIHKKGGHLEKGDHWNSPSKGRMYILPASRSMESTTSGMAGISCTFPSGKVMW